MNSTKATRTEIQIGSITVNGFMLPDGSYRMSQTQAAECVGKPEINTRRFLNSKTIQELVGQDFTPDSVEIESAPGTPGQSRFNALPLEIVTAYWVSQCFQGNRQALALVMALATETLERRFDTAFGTVRAEQVRDQRLHERIEAVETGMNRLGEGDVIEDDIHQELNYLDQLLKDYGMASYMSLPGSEVS
ncbi:MAG: hypothetical protein F6K19_20865 [Cyanothece sp. SIO1E1]|nr:hypothetical protein [Cyanothece sp. SIO1E1]